LAALFRPDFADRRIDLFDEGRLVFRHGRTQHTCQQRAVHLVAKLSLEAFLRQETQSGGGVVHKNPDFSTSNGFIERRSVWVGYQHEVGQGGAQGFVGQV
jgi:hypothetical protein